MQQTDVRYLNKETQTGIRRQMNREWSSARVKTPLQCRCPLITSFHSSVHRCNTTVNCTVDCRTIALLKTMQISRWGQPCQPLPPREHVLAVLCFFDRWRNLLRLLSRRLRNGIAGAELQPLSGRGDFESKNTERKKWRKWVFCLNKNSRTRRALLQQLKRMCGGQSQLKLLIYSWSVCLCNRTRSDAVFKVDGFRYERLLWAVLMRMRPLPCFLVGGVLFVNWDQLSRLNAAAKVNECVKLLRGITFLHNVSSFSIFHSAVI